MSETYVEYLVKRKTSFSQVLLKNCAWGFAVFSVLLGLIGDPIFLLIGMVTGVLAYFLGLNTEIEYEYLFLNKELSVDKIKAQTKRKKVREFDLNKVEIVAPTSSHRLDSYKNMEHVVRDYTSKTEEKGTYSFVYKGDKEIAIVKIEMTEEILNFFKTIAPRKVFTD